MAFMQNDEWYVYDSGAAVVFDGPSDKQSAVFPMDIMEDLVAMMWHRMTPERQGEVMDRVVARWGDQLGADGVLAALGRETNMEWVIHQALGKGR